MNNPIRSFNNHHKMFGSLDDYLEKEIKPDIFECPCCNKSFEPKQCEIISKEPKCILYCPHCDQKLQQCDNGFEVFTNDDAFDNNLTLDTEYAENYSEDQMNDFINKIYPKAIAFIYITTEAPEMDLCSKLDHCSPDYDEKFADKYDDTMCKFNDLCCKEQYYNTPEFYNNLHQYVNENLDLETVLNQEDEALDIKKDNKKEPLLEIDDEDDGRFELCAHKSVPDSDGFTTDYCMYKDNADDTYFCMFGDSELYGPDPDNADVNFDTFEEAQEWFNNYEGFTDEEDEDIINFEDDITNESLTEAKNNAGTYTITFFHNDATFTGVIFAKDEETARARFEKWCPSCTIDRVMPGMLCFDSYTITPEFEENMGWDIGDDVDPDEIDFMEDDVVEEPIFNDELTNESVNKEELVETDLHPSIKNQIKKDYKSWDATRDQVNDRRNDLANMLKDHPNQDNVRKVIDKVAPEVKPFEFDFPKSLEKGNYPYYVTYYAEYPIYEPAEGGYYYAGCDALESTGFNSYEEAKEALDKYVAENASDGWQEYTNGYIIPSARGYIGEDEFIVIEDNKEYLSQIRGKVPYC